MNLLYKKNEELNEWLAGLNFKGSDSSEVAQLEGQVDKKDGWIRDLKDEVRRLWELLGMGGPASSGGGYEPSNSSEILDDPDDVKQALSWAKEENKLLIKDREELEDKLQQMKSKVWKRNDEIHDLREELARKD